MSGNGVHGVLEAFAGSLLQATAAENEEFVISPSCLYRTLVPLALGAAGKTRSQLEEVLGDGADAEKRMAVACDASALSMASEDYALTSAGSLWVDDLTELRPSFEQKVAELGGTEVHSCDLHSRQTARAMGEWVSANTGGKFCEALESSPTSRLVIIGATYFRDAWASDFYDDGEVAPFYASGGAYDVSFMKDVGGMLVLEDNGGVTVGKALSSGAMVVFSMPDEGIDVEEYVASGHAWENLVDYVHEPWHDEECVDLRVPKIDLDSSGVDATSALARMGLGVAFAPEADFSGMSHDPLYADSCIQSTKFSMDERGVEGASYVTIAVAGSVPAWIYQEPRRIAFDRPFAFAAFSSAGAPLFVGVLQRPVGIDCA